MRGKAIGLFAFAVLWLLHGWAIWWGLGGWAGLTNGWPMCRDDHPLYYHSALVTRSFLRTSWTTAGYDPSFMAGYAKSVIFPASSTLPELVIAVCGGDHPDFAYKLYVLIAAAAVPGVIALAGFCWRISPLSMALAVLLHMIYLWTGFPINYVEFGMVPYFLGVPLALLATGAFGRFLARGGFVGWLAAVGTASFAFLVHLTTAMVVLPALVGGYAGWMLQMPGSDARNHRSRPRRAASRDPAPSRSGLRRHIAVWLMPLFIAGFNVFWWWPGIWVASTKGPSGFAFAHPEGVGKRLLQIVTVGAPMEAILIGAAVPGIFLLARRIAPDSWALLGFAAAGLFWGYLSGAFRSLDFLQPGRHTYAFYTALAIAGGVAIDEMRRRLSRARGGGNSLGCWILAGVVVVGIRVLWFPMIEPAIRAKLLSGEPFLSSRPSPRLNWVIDHVRRNLKPGERLLYEESGFDIPAAPDPYRRGRYSGLLPELTGVEVIGGPYLHASLTTNFTQFGEGKLFGREDWDRDFFIRYAKLYRPAGILCWSPHARRFCKENPDLVRMLDDDGTLFFGRVVGFEGSFIVGSGDLSAEAGRIRIRNLTPDLDGSVVLRYHSVPGLVTRPPVASELDFREDDPVPFLRLRPTPGVREVGIEMQLPGWR